MICFVENHAAPYSHGLICTYWGANQRVLGHIILSNTRPISPFEEDIAQIIMKHLNMIQAASQRTPEIHQYENTDEVLLSNLLASREPQTAQNHLKVNHGISQEDQLCLAVSRSREAQIRDYLRKEISRRLPCSVCICREDEIIVLFWQKQRQPAYPEFLSSLAAKTETVFTPSSTAKSGA